MEKGDIGSMLTRMGVSGWMFLLVLAYLGSPRKRAIKLVCDRYVNRMSQIYLAQWRRW